MSAEPTERAERHDVIRLGGEEAVVVPIAEYRLLSALRERATPEEIEEAEGEALLAGYDEWVARGRPGAKSHEEFMAEILGGAR
jgi:hypothetical protein